MKTSIFTILILSLTLIGSSILNAQEKRDTTIIFEPANPNLFQSTKYHPKRNAWGFDLMASDNGFAAGVFFRKEFSEEIAWFIALAISDIKDEAEVEYYDYFGQPFVPGKKNRALMIPLVGGIQYRLFKDDIMDNFRPYVTAGVGPSMIYVSPYANVTRIKGPDGSVFTFTEQIDFFESLGKGQAKYTLGGFIGIGAYFGLDKGTLSGVSIRYYYVPYWQGIEIFEQKKTRSFGGIYLTLNFGSIY